MNIQTKYHGEVAVKVDEILTFTNGIPGFIDEKQFTLLPLPDQTAISVMQSVRTPTLAFIVADPYTFFHPYQLTLDENTVELLAITSEDDVSALVILTVKDPFEASTANMQAPIIINIKTNNAKQVILTAENYQTKHPLFGSPIKG